MCWTRTEKAIGVTVFVLCFVFVFALYRNPPAVTTQMSSQAPKFSYGINGLTEQRCINGTWFLIGRSGTPAQMLDASGRPMACN